MIRYPYDENGFYTFNPVETEDMLPNTTSVNPENILKPKIENSSDPDSGWIMGMTPEEIEIYLGDLKTIRDSYLTETNTQTLSNHHERIPLTELERTSRKNAEIFYKTEVLKVDPNFVFPDKTKMPAFEWTYRQTVSATGTSIVMDEIIDSEILREVCVEGQPIYSYTWDFDTQTLSGINVSAGDHIKIMY